MKAEYTKKMKKCPSRKSEMGNCSNADQSTLSDAKILPRALMPQPRGNDPPLLHRAGCVWVARPAEHDLFVPQCVGMAETCIPHHDWFTSFLTGGLCVGIFISYIPQHLRIILANSSEGFSPWFLLLGSLSSASGMLNIVVKQWSIIKCCRVVSVGACIESTAGIFQLSLQWIMFTMIMVLYMMYYPSHLKYAAVEVDMHDNRPPMEPKTSVKRDEWRLSIILSWVVLLYTLLVTLITFSLLATNPSPDAARQAEQLSLWATFLGVTSTLLAAFQYLPQIIHTYRHKLVGALSIGMMLIQTPGAVLMVLSIALRPGTNWTTWSPYAAAGILQGILLVMCLLWSVRQHKLGIDDFGNPLVSGDPPSEGESPIPVTRDPQDGSRVEDAVHTAVHTNLRDDNGPDTPTVNEVSGEHTPLLKKNDGQATRGWLGGLFQSSRR